MWILWWIAYGNPGGQPGETAWIFPAAGDFFPAESRHFSTVSLSLSPLSPKSIHRGKCRFLPL